MEISVDNPKKIYIGSFIEDTLPQVDGSTRTDAKSTRTNATQSKTEPP